MIYKALKYFELTGLNGKPFDTFNPTEKRKVRVSELLELGKDINKSTAEILIKLKKIRGGGRDEQFYNSQS